MGGEGGVVSAAVLGMKNESDIEHLGFKLGVSAVRSEQVQDIFRRREVVFRAVYYEPVAVEIISFRVSSRDWRRTFGTLRSFG